MKKVLFATDFKGGVSPTIDGEMAIFEADTNTYLDFGDAGNIASYSNITLQVQRDSEILSFPINPKNYSIDYGLLPTADAQTLTWTPTGTVSVSKVYTLAVAVAGRATNMNRYTKKYQVTPSAATIESLLDAFTAAIGANADDIPGITFTCTDTASVLTLTVGSSYKDQKLTAWVEDAATELDSSFNFNSSTGDFGLTEAEIKKLESDSDTHLGDGKYKFRTVDSSFSVDSGYDSDCTHLAVIKTASVMDHALPKENNFDKELLLFYDSDKVVDAGDTPATLATIMTWLDGTLDSFPADIPD